MYNLLTLLVFVLAFLTTLVYLSRENSKRDKTEKERFREFVIATKSQNTEEYIHGLPADDTPLPVEESDEFVDLDQVDPEQLLRVIKENENK